jgi:hypothetical protein
MRRVLLRVLTLSLFVAVAWSSAHAQVTDTIVADIPFDFTVRDTTLPAGHYTLSRTDPSKPGIMVIRAADGHGKMLFVVESAQVNKEPKKTELIFDRVEDQYFLSEIFEEGNNLGVELAKSHAERRLEEEGAMIEVHSVMVPGQTVLNARH